MGDVTEPVARHDRLAVDLSRTFGGTDGMHVDRDEVTHVADPR